ncbi:glycohydrolase toxin TNT-related protein [Microbacterium sp. bgisy203]|uniref:glycohydrolase toxin TNT-related protein n=1 Tax=Microbacterium sp. bgisy203 TaxID=3413799 RepID=UPI003D705D3D
MSAIKPIFRELKDAALKGFGALKHKLHQFADALDGHADDVIRRVRGQDHLDAPGSSRGVSAGETDELVPRPECLDGAGNIDWSQAPGNGFRLDADGNPITRDHVPDAGDRFDRYGDERGRYVSPVPEDGPFSFDSRSLPYQENPNAYHQYEWSHSPSDVQAVYSGLDDVTRASVDADLAKYGLEVGDLAHVTRGEAAPIPAWGTAGGATQDLLPASVALLKDMGMIVEVR